MFINTIWTFGANDFLHRPLYPRQVIVIYIYSAMCSADLFWGCSCSLSWGSCCGQAFHFYSQRFPKASANGTENFYTFNLFVAFSVTPSVHVRLHNLHVAIWFPLNHSPSERLNPRLDFPGPLHNEGKTHKIKRPWAKTRWLPNLIKQCVCLLSRPWLFAWE